MILCPKCGYENKDEALYCGMCYENFKKKIVPTLSQEMPPAAMSGPPPAPPEKVPAPEEDSNKYDKGVGDAFLTILFTPGKFFSEMPSRAGYFTPLKYAVCLYSGFLLLYLLLSMNLFVLLKGFLYGSVISFIAIPLVLFLHSGLLFFSAKPFVREAEYLPVFRIQAYSFFTGNCIWPLLCYITFVELKIQNPALVIILSLIFIPLALFYTPWLQIVGIKTVFRTTYLRAIATHLVWILSNFAFLFMLAFIYLGVQFKNGFPGVSETAQLFGNILKNKAISSVSRGGRAGEAAAPRSRKIWHVSDASGNVTGPFSLEQFQDIPFFTRDTLLFKEGETEWKNASEFSEFAFLFMEPPRRQEPATAPHPVFADSSRYLVVNESNPGEMIEVSDYLDSSRINIFDFYSDYCGPCRSIAPLLKRLTERRNDVAVRKVDINRRGVSGIDWQSPVVRQYGIRSVPYFMVYYPSTQKWVKGREAGAEVNKLLR